MGAVRAAKISPQQFQQFDQNRSPTSIDGKTGVWQTDL
jgi:hypothetical protein